MKTQTLNFAVGPVWIAALLLFAHTAGHAQPSTIRLQSDDPVLRIVGKDTGDRCGIAVEVIDVVGDSAIDLVVASDFAEGFEDQDRSGRVDIFDGSLLPPRGLIDLDNPVSPQPHLTLFGEEEEQGLFGERILFGDFDGDLRTDIVVSAPNFDGSGESLAGRVYLFLGGVALPGSTRTLFERRGPVSAARAHVIIEGEARSDRVGLNLASGDFNGDGFDDLVASAPSSEEEIEDEAGRVYVIPGRADWSGDSSILLGPARTIATASAVHRIRVFAGSEEYERIGESLAVADLNRDGFPELLIGVDHANLVDPNLGTFLRVGRVYVISGPRVFEFPPGIGETRLDADAADLVLTGKSQFDSFGDNFLVNDWDGDGFEDVWISAPFAELAPLGNDEDDWGIVSLLHGASSLISRTGLKYAGLFDFSTSWLDTGFGPDHLLGTVAKGRAEGLLSTELRYPAGASIAIVGPDDTNENETLFGGSMAVGDVLGNDGVTELVIAASRFDGDEGSEKDSGAISILTRDELLGATPASPRILSPINPETLRIEGEDVSDRFGLRVRSADLLSSPGQELVVGAPFADSDVRSAGVVYVINLGTLSASRPTKDKPVAK